MHHIALLLGLLAIPVSVWRFQLSSRFSLLVGGLPILVLVGGSYALNHEPQGAVMVLASVVVNLWQPEWCAKRDLNPHALRHLLLRQACLPFHHSRQNGACGGIRTPGPLFTGQPLYQLSYTGENGGPSRSRTDDILLAGQALSRLSYGPVEIQKMAARHRVER